MKLNDILKIIKKNELDLENKEILKSIEFEGYLKSVSKELYEKLNINQDKLSLTIDKKKDASYIKGDTIYINVGSKFINSENNKLKIILGYYAHEIAHRLFTDFSVRKEYEQAILDNNWYPKVPKLDYLYEYDKKVYDKFERANNYIKEAKQSGKLCSILLFLYDIMEDSIVEEKMYEHLGNYGRLIDGLNIIRNKQFKEVKTYKEDLEKEGKFYALLNQVACYIKFGQFKGLDEKTIEYIDEVKRLIDEAMKGLSKEKVLDNINKISVLLWDDIEIYLDKFNDSYEEKNKKIKSIVSTEVSKELEDKVKITSKLGDSNTKGIKDEEAKTLNKKEKDLVESINDETMDIDSDGVSGYKNHKANDENALKLKNKSKEDKGLDNDTHEDSESLSGEMTSKDSIGQGDFKFSNIEEEKEKRRELNNNARSISYGDVHKGIKINVHRPEFSYEDKLRYIKNSRTYMEIAEQLSKKVLPLLENEVSNEYSNNRYYGTKFNAQSVVKKDFRYFSKKNPPNESPSIAIALRIDESGSMKAQGRIEMARAAAIMLWEFCKACDIPIGIYGDSADISKFEDVSIYSYSDFKNQDENDCYRLMNISPKSNNRDGVSIKFVSERLLNVDADIKLLLVISDGKPLAKPDYKGNVAKEDLKQLISEYSRKGINFLAAAIGEDKETIKRIYGNERFLDISDLKYLPNRISIILKNII